ncbi:MAG: hydrogenase maturation nickel metallochaperone HypA [Candidatus Fermentibacteraceae bacterium]|nr:hydrogenase maturation nickel metallochaperone HypA [Candidatus Fermentibacteraceae bacterium]
MHELSLAVDMVEQLCEVLERENAHRVVELTVVIGAMSGVERVPFEFAFPVAAENTPLEGAEMKIEEVPLVIKCNDCDLETEIQDPVMICPRCNSVSVEIVRGREFLVKSMEVK